MAAHAKLSASSSARWLNCPGSVRATENLPNPSSKYALEGSAAHELGELCLKSGDNTHQYLGKKLPETRWQVDEEMVEYVQEYVDLVRQTDPRGDMEVEVHLDFSHIVPDGFGTSDVVICNPVTKTLTVIDLKYGKGIQVEAEDNTQALLYALGALSDYELLYPIETIRCVIIQPRLDHVSEWEISKEEVLKRGEEIRQKALRCFEPDAPRIASEKACQWCLAKASCPELLAYTSNAILREFDAFEPLQELLPSPDTLTDEQMGNALASKKLILSWLDSIEHLATDRILQGGSFKGYKIVSGRVSRSWTNEEDAKQALEPILGGKLFTEPELISVAQAEKALGKKHKDALAPLVNKTNGKATLVPESDPRQPLGAITASAFDCFDEIVVK